MLLGPVLALLVADCPTIDLMTLPSPAPVPAVVDGGPPRPDFTVELASKRSAVVPSVFGPVDLGSDGALVAAVRCTARTRQGEPAGSCEVVVAHLAPVGVTRALELSGLVGTLPARGKDAVITGLAVRDLFDGAEREVIVRWRTADGTAVAILRWEGFTRAWASPRVIGCEPRVAIEAHGCARAPMLDVQVCDHAERWQWRPKVRELVRMRR